ncbi:MAG: hypothetical protein ACI9U2_005003 [Bradymonadia bacterium]
MGGIAACTGGHGAGRHRGADRTAVGRIDEGRIDEGRIDEGRTPRRHIDARRLTVRARIGAPARTHSPRMSAVLSARLAPYPRSHAALDEGRVDGALQRAIGLERGFDEAGRRAVRCLLRSRPLTTLQSCAVFTWWHARPDPASPGAYFLSSARRRAPARFALSGVADESAIRTLRVPRLAFARDYRQHGVPVAARVRSQLPWGRRPQNVCCEPALQRRSRWGLAEPRLPATQGDFWKC